MTTSPRVDSLSIEDIENLYHNHQDRPSLQDLAHPEDVFLFDAHDKLNGRIGTPKHKQNEIIGKITHPTNALLERTIYAQSELFDEVIKLGFQMQREEQEDLTDLADCCAEQMYQAMHKTAFLPAIPAAVWLATGGVATVLTTLGLVNNFGPSLDKGVVGNCARALQSLQEINEDFPKLTPQVVTMIKNIAFVKGLGEQAMHSDLTAETATKETIDAATLLLEKYKKATQLLSQYVPNYIALLSAAQPDDDSGDFMSVLKSVYHKISPDAIKSSVTALHTLQESLLKSGEAITAYEHGLQSFLSQNKEAIDELLAKQQISPAPEVKSEKPSLEELVNKLPNS